LSEVVRAQDRFVVTLSFPTRRSAQIARRSFNGRDADNAASRRRRVRFDGRSAQAVAIRKRVAAYSKRLGAAADEPFVRERIIELAELEVLTGQLRANALNSQHVDLFELNRMTNATNRLRRSLGLSDRPPEPPAPSLESYRRKHEATP